jgi:hypothetical protein
MTAKDKKKKGGSNNAETVKTLASLLAQDGGGVDVVNEKVGPELEASGRLAVLLE